MKTVMHVGEANLEPNLSMEVISYLRSGIRTPASDCLMGAMTDIPYLDSSKPPAELAPTNLRDLQACRIVMRTPEARGRLDDMHRLGGRWSSVATLWDELCAIHDKEHQSSVESDAPRTSGSLTWLLVSNRGLDLPKVDALVIAQHPGVHLDGWILFHLQRDFIEIGHSHYSLEPDVMAAGYVKFGCPRRVFFCRVTP